MSSQAITIESSPKLPLAGKYDGRRNNGGDQYGLGEISNTGPKPRRRRDLYGRKAVTQLRKMYACKEPHIIFAELLKAKNVGLAWQVFIDMHDRALGRPYVQTAPDAVPQQAIDNRLQMAVNTLIVQGPQGKHSRRKDLALEQSGSLAGIQAAKKGPGDA